MASANRRSAHARLATVTSLVAVVTGILLVLVGACGTDQPPAPPRSDATQAAAPQAPAVRSTPGSESPSPATSTESHVAGLPRSEPTTLSIPSIDVRSDLIDLGLQKNQEMEVPRGADYDRAGWFTESPTPGEIGPTVIAGHVDGDDGPSVFYRLGALKDGDEVTVTRADGKAATFRVYRAERYAKDDFPTERVYGNTAGPELRLITCSGGVGPDGHYLDNTVVYARLAPA